MLDAQEYKQTELGLIPQEWSVKCLGDIGKLSSCKRIFNSQTSSLGDIPFYKIGTFGKVADAYISKEIYEQYKANYNFPQKGDVLISASGTIGRLVVYDGRPAYFQDSNIAWLKHNEKDILNKYLLYVYRQIRWQIEGTTIARLYNNNFNELKIIVPPIKEQQAITDVLNDTDNLISSLQKLIDKKKAIKQGIMEELLTGKRRLPGFYGEWVDVRLGDILEIKKGTTLTSSKYKIGNVPVMAGGKDYAGLHDRFNRPKWTITISASGASAGFVKIHPNEIFATDCSTIEPNVEYNIIYIYYILLINQNLIYTQQTGGAQPHIHPKDLYPLHIKYAIDIAEQDAIAKVLSDMDKEIDKLEKKLAKYDKIKQGMMKKLLTGQIRLLE